MYVTYSEFVVWCYRAEKDPEYHSRLSEYHTEKAELDRLKQEEEMERRYLAAQRAEEEKERKLQIKQRQEEKR